MNEKEVFDFLFETAKKSKDPKGIVSACLVDNGNVIAYSANSDDGIYHAETILTDEILKKKILFSSEAVLFSTLLPCCERQNPALKSCADAIIEAGIKNVIFGAQNPDCFSKTGEKFAKAGVSMRQASDPEIVRRCALTFNESVAKDRKDVKLKPFGSLMILGYFFVDLFRNLTLK